MQMVPQFKMKKFFFPTELKEEDIMVEAMQELESVMVSGFKAKHDDFLDTISMLNEISAFPPSESAPKLDYDSSKNYWHELEEEENNYAMESYIV